MDGSKPLVSCREARQLDLVSYLSSLGYQPAKIRNEDYWYHSPLRVERTPSFKVNRTLNRWYDHGTGEGGNLIDFAIRYHDCTVGEFLKRLTVPSLFQQPVPPATISCAVQPRSPLHILKEGPLQSLSLLRYLYQRRIPIALAKPFCSEVHYELSGRRYVAIGFKNNQGGYELRSPYFKGSTSPKSITTFDNKAREVAVFEGFFDFLSFQALLQNQRVPPCNALVLNSLSFFEKARPFLEQHDRIRLYLDGDTAGQNCIRQALTCSPKYQDQSPLYRGYKDLNDWMQHIGRPSPKIGLHLKAG